MELQPVQTIRDNFLQETQQQSHHKSANPAVQAIYPSLDLDPNIDQPPQQHADLPQKAAEQQYRQGQSNCLQSFKDRCCQIWEQLLVFFILSVPFVPFVVCNFYFAYASDDECLDIGFLGSLTIRMWMTGGGYLILGMLLVVYITVIANILYNGGNTWVYNLIVIFLLFIFLWVVFGEFCDIEDCGSGVKLYIQIILIVKAAFPE